MRTHVIKEGTVLLLMALQIVSSQREYRGPTILEGIENVAFGATNLLMGIIQRPKELIHRVTDTATDYIFSAVETPKNLILNATKATTGYIDSAASRGLEFKLRRFLEKFRTRMPYGLPELGIPPLEPFYLDEINIELDNQEIGNLSISVKNLYIHNLSTFVINKAKLSVIEPTITANVSVPKILVQGSYNISGKLAFIVPIHNAGPIDAIVKDFQLYVYAMLGYFRGLYLREFDLDFSLKYIQANLDKFVRDAELSRVMSKVFQELTPKAIEIIKPDILPAIQSYIGGQINDTIHHLTMRDVISVLIGRNEIREFAHLVIP